MVRLAIRTLSAALVLGMVGCNQTARSGVTELRYMAWGNPQQLGVEQHLCDVFNADNPDLHVSLIRVPGTAYRSKAIVMLATGTGPDVLRIDHYDFSSLQEKGYFRDLTSLAQADPGFRKADFWPQTLQEGTVDGHLFGLNVLFGGILIYYNRSMIERSGLDDPYDVYRRGGWTWNVFREYAKSMTHGATGSESGTFGALVPSTLAMLAPIVWAYGGDLLSSDHKHCRLGEPAAATAIQFLADMRYADHSAPTTTESANAAFPFEGGRIGMMFDYMGMSPRYREMIKDFDWDVVPIPSGPAGGASLLKGNQLVMAAGTPHPAAAWRFMRFLTGVKAENELYVKLRRCFPTRIAVAESPAYLTSDHPPHHMQAFVDAIRSGRPLPIDDRWSEWTNAVQPHLDEIMAGRIRKVGPEMALAAAAADKVLAQEPGW